MKKHASGRPAPRYAATGAVVVRAPVTAISHAGTTYAPGRSRAWFQGGPAAAFISAPPSGETTRARSAVMCPSASSASSPSQTEPREWLVVTWSSLRVATHLTGRPSRRASHASSTSSR